jgi:hypothetical protein
MDLPAGSHLSSVGPPPVVNAFWIGRRLGAISRACLRSFLRHGHPVHLHVYEEPEDVPAGLVLHDAAKIMSRSLAVPHRKTGSYALASDRFRYELMAADVGIYVDCDCYCLRPVCPRDYMFGWESNEFIGAGVLKMPPDSKLLRALRDVFRIDGFIPPWMTESRQRHMRWRRMLGRPVALEDMAWGTAGPRALSYYAKEAGVADRARPPDIYYPLSFHHAGLLTDPEIGLGDLVTSRSEIIHLWNEYWRQAGLGNVPAGSPLALILAEGET